MIRLVFTALLLTLFSVCSFVAQAAEWSEKDRFVVPVEWGLKQFPYGKMLTVALDPDTHLTTEQFNLFYFTPAPFDKSKKTVLFVAGGPGRILGPMPEDFQVVKDKFNIVFYHPRGGGLSQSPADKSYDKYLTSKNIVHDLEAIRRDLRIEQWDLVYGFSHGTILSQMYGHLFPRATKRFVYDGTVTYWQLRNNQSFHYQTPINVKKVLQLDHKKNFRQLTTEDIIQIKNYVAQMNEAFKEEQRSYINLLNNDDYKKEETLKKFPILRGRSSEFLLATYMALYMGWSPVNVELGKKQQAIGLILAGDLFPEKIDVNELEKAKDYMRSQSHTMVAAVKSSGDAAPVKFPAIAQRVFLTVAYADAEGTVEVNGEQKQFPERIYNPLLYPHHIETMLLHGSGDGASPVEGAEQIIREALKGPVKFVLANGANHGAFFKGTACEASLLTQLINGAEFDAIVEEMHTYATTHLVDELHIK